MKLFFFSFFLVWTFYNDSYSFTMPRVKCRWICRRLGTAIVGLVLHSMVLKTEPGVKPFFFLKFPVQPSVFTRFLTGFRPVFRFLIGCWSVLGVLTGPDWLPVPGWTGRTGRSGPVFKTVLHSFALRNCTRNWWSCEIQKSSSIGLGLRSDVTFS